MDRTVRSFIDYQLVRFFKENSNEDVPERRLDEVQLWNCFSYYPAVTSWDILDGQMVNT